MRENKQELNSKQIMKKIESAKESVKKYGVKKIGLFGSFLKKKQHKKSDIDILVEFDNPKFNEYMELKFMLEKLFRKKVDLVMIKNIKPALSYVKKEAIYAKL